MRFEQLVWGLVLVNVVALSIAQDYTFEITETTHKLLCNDVNVMLVNGTIPGPTLNLTYGETVTVNVINYIYSIYFLTRPHWHGVKQPRNPWSDGPEYVTQCPIKPGDNFTYEIILSDEEGTLWWHAHSEWSRATVYGALVIVPADGSEYPYSVQPDGDQELILGTWFEKDVMEYVEEYLDHGQSLPNTYEALTINGQPGDSYYNTMCALDVADITMFEMEVEYGKTYLLRIINAAMNEDLAFAVAGHNLTVVGSDAAYIEPIVTDMISITSGQTMDVLLVADQTPGYYYMEAKHFRGSPGDGMSSRGLIKYSSSDSTTGVLPDMGEYFTSVADFTQQFRALNNSNYTYDVPETVDTQIFMTVSLNSGQSCSTGMGCNVTGSGSLSNVSFVNPAVDVLQAYYLNLSNVYTTDFPEKSPEFDYTNATGVSTYSVVNGTKVFVVDYNSTVEMVFQGTNLVFAMAHPMHVHGYSFYVVAWGQGNYDNDTAVYNLVDPPLVNTVSFPVNGWVAVRFRANNPGVWFIHCHLERHSFVGMAATMIVSDGDTEETSMLAPSTTPTGTCDGTSLRRILD